MCPGILHTRWEIKCPHEKEAFAEKIVLGRNAAGLRGWKGECSCTSPLGLWKPWDGHGGGGGGSLHRGPRNRAGAEGVWTPRARVDPIEVRTWVPSWPVPGQPWCPFMFL